MNTGVLFIAMLFLSFRGLSQDLSKMNKDNTWLKAGPYVGLPISGVSSTHQFIIGLDLSLQFIETEAYAVGFKTGYAHYLPKENNDAIGEIPLALFSRFYPKTSGLFAGLEVGYSVLRNFAAAKGGYCTRPHAGFHTDNWNFFAFYELIFFEDEKVNDIQSIGISATYNFHFN
jgi:hypothetical protein